MRRPSTPSVPSLFLAVAMLSGAAACRPVEPPCEPGTRPVVMAHGLLASGDTWATQQQRFATNGHCGARVLAFDWNTLGEADPVPQLDAFIDAALAASGESKVDLVGHSAGGSLGYRYLADPVRAAKVAKYVHVGSGLSEGPAGPEGATVPTLNLWSEADTVIRDKGDIPGATNVMLPGQDHYAIATSAASFGEIWTFLKGAPPRTTQIEPFGSVTLSGRAVTLGENVPVAGGRVEVFAIGADGARNGGARAVFTTGDDGSWGPFEGDPGTAYEFLVTSANPDDVPVHYYREPFTRPSGLVYLRTLPSPDTIAGGLLAGIKYDDAHAVVIVFTANRALLDTRDTLTVNGATVDLAQVAKASQTTIALFTYDADRDGTSDATPIPSLGIGSFLAGVDLFHPAGDAALPVTLNDVTLRARAWPSVSSGVSVVVFE